jgi:DNA-directed RNA polymerase specialized sigma24 family protein
MHTDAYERDAFAPLPGGAAACCERRSGMPERCPPSQRTFQHASETDLVVGLSRRDEQALKELTQRHAAALSVLACAIVGRPASARRAVADVFAAIWVAPDQVGMPDVSVRAQLAALVHERCKTELEPSNRRADASRRGNATRRSTNATAERIAVALIAFGDHTCWQAAERVGSRTAVVAERLRAFVLDPDHFAPFFTTDDNVVPLRAMRGPRRVKSDR